MTDIIRRKRNRKHREALQKDAVKSARRKPRAECKVRLLAEGRAKTKKKEKLNAR